MSLARCDNMSYLDLGVRFLYLMMSDVNESKIHTYIVIIQFSIKHYLACGVVVTAVSKLREHMRCHSQEKLVRNDFLFKNC